MLRIVFDQMNLIKGDTLWAKGSHQEQSHRSSPPKTKGPRFPEAL